MKGHGGDLKMAARHSGTVVTSTTAPSYTSAAWGGRPSVEPRPGAQRRHRRASTAAMVVRLPSQKRDEGDQEKKLKPNRLGQSEEELWAELMAPTAAAETGRGPAAAVRTAKVARAGHGRATV